MKTPILPCADRVLVTQLKAKETVGEGKSLLYIPEQAKEPPSFGIVRSIGHAVKDTNIRPDIMIVFGKYSGTELEVDGKKFLLMREDEISGIVCDGTLADKFVTSGA